MQHVNIMANFTYLAEERIFLISVESQVSIDYCILHCDLDFEIVDVERNLAILSVTKTEGKPGLVATFRCQANTTRLEMKVGCFESNTFNVLKLYVSPNINPRCVIKKQFYVPALCLHVRSHSSSWDIPFSRLTFKGGLTLADIHSWLRLCLPNIPEKVPPEDDVDFYFIHSRWKTRLTCHYKKGEILFCSDNLMVLLLLREFISREATAKNIHFNMSFDMSSESTGNVVQSIHADLTTKVLRLKQQKLAEILEESITDQKSSNDTTSWMSDGLQQIYRANKDCQVKEGDFQKEIEECLDFLTELYKCQRGFLGNINYQISPDLRKTLMTWPTEELVHVFLSLEGFESK